jgi:simple sugar transport system permease protein
VLVGGYIVSALVAVGLSAILLAVTHYSPVAAIKAVYTGALGSPVAWGRTLEQTAPLLIVAVGSIVSNRAGVFNIGQEGQVLIGAMTAALVALKVPGPSPLIMAFVFVAAFAGGAIWAGIAAALKLWRNVDVIISTLLLIFIAQQVVQLAVTRAWFLQQHVGSGIASPQSDYIPNDLRPPQFGSQPHFYLQTGLLIALGLTAVFGWLIFRTRWGFRLRMLGLNPNAARRAGVSFAAVGGGALLISGGLAGVAGGVTLTSTVFTLQPTISNNIGWNGLLIALVAQNRPDAAILVALFFGALQAGGGFLATTGVPGYLVNIVQALFVLSALFPPMFLSWLDRRREARSRPALPESAVVA